jgi:small conductance mechanosensitive channel
MNETNVITQTAQEVKELINPTTASKIWAYVEHYGVVLLLALLILMLGAWVAKMIRGAAQQVLTKRNLDPIVVNFVSNLVYVVLMAFVILAALGKLGIQTTSFVAVIGAAGLAIGLALQGSLANFAAGFLLVVFRPFKKGDYIEAAGTAGIVQEIQVFNTILTTPDNRRVIVPNAKVTSDNITNYSALETRRLDLTYGVSYRAALAQVKEVLHRVAAADARILKEPAPQVVLTALADSSVNFQLRVYVKPADYWGVAFDTNEQVKLAFDGEGIEIPFPQRDVHLYQAKSSGGQS